MDIAIENKRLDIALMLLSYKMNTCGDYEPLFVKTAKAFNDIPSLNKIIPALFEAGVKYYDINPWWSFSAVKYDAFYTAAKEKNENFIKILSAEVKKRGADLASSMIYRVCPGSADMESLKKWLEKEEPTRLLKKYGVEVNIKIETLYDDSCD